MAVGGCWPGPRGRPGGHIRLILGGGRVPGGWGQCAPGPPAGGQRVQDSAGEAGPHRFPPFGGPATDAPAAGGMDCAGGGALTAGADPLPGQAGGAAQRLQLTGPRGAGEVRGQGDHERPVWVSGLGLLDDTALPPVYLQRMDSLQGLIETIDAELWALEAPIQARLRGHQGYQTIQRIPGVGPVLGAVLVAEIGDVAHFRDAAALCTWAGLTPRHRPCGGGAPDPHPRLLRPARRRDPGPWPGPLSRPPDGCPDPARCVLVLVSGLRKA